MGNVFCEHIGKLLPSPVFHLGIENGVVKDLTGGVNIANNGVVVRNDSTEGDVCDFRNGYVNTNFLQQFEDLWYYGDFSIEFKIYLLSVQSSALIFTTTYVGAPSYAGSFYIDASGKEFRFYYKEGNAFIRRNIELNKWMDVKLIVKNKTAYFYVNQELAGTDTISDSINSRPALIGALSNAGSGVAGYRVNGYISYFKIYDKPIK